MESNKRWALGSLTAIACILITVGTATITIDPFFHYHKPLASLQYPMEEERYLNDGIIRNFEYDALITGTSMTENFKTSEMDVIFGTQAIKIPFAGATYREIDENISKAIDRNPDLKYVVRGLDYKFLLHDKDAYAYDSYPTYLYDDNIWNDVSYWFNKDIWMENTLRVLGYTRAGDKTPDFDTYARWADDGRVYGKEGIFTYYTRPGKCQQAAVLTETERELVIENIDQNVVSLAQEHPEITFYYFITPYSIYYWDSLNQVGILEKQLEVERVAIEEIVECDNIKLFSFFDNFELICEPNNYKDTTHYSEEVNSMILQWMYEGEYQLTKENYLEYCEKLYEFYTVYDYDALYEM